MKAIKKILLKTRLKSLINKLQHFGVSENDIIIAGYPKSGSTWFRFLLYEILTGKDATFEEVNNFIPTIGKQFNRNIKIDNHRYLKTHESYRKEYNKTIVIIRDVRDVIISEYYYNKKMGHINSKMTLSNFIQLFVYRQTNRFGNYNENVRSWIDYKTQHPQNVLFVKYEDLKKDTVSKFKEVCEFLSINISEGRLREIIKNNSLSKMREKETISSDKTLKSKDNSIPFVREGKSKNWTDAYSANELTLINQSFDEVLNYFNYNNL